MDVAAGAGCRNVTFRNSSGLESRGKDSRSRECIWRASAVKRGAAASSLLPSISARQKKNPQRDLGSMVNHQEKDTTRLLSLLVAITAPDRVLT